MKQRIIKIFKMIKTHFYCGLIFGMVAVFLSFISDNLTSIIIIHISIYIVAKYFADKYLMKRNNKMRFSFGWIFGSILAGISLIPKNFILTIIIFVCFFIIIKHFDIEKENKNVY